MANVVVNTVKQKWNTKLYDCGKGYEVVHFRNREFGGSGNIIKSDSPFPIRKRAKRGEGERYYQRRFQNLRAVKSKIRRLVKLNRFEYFITLTFREMVEVARADKEFRLWTMRMKYRVPEFRYIAVREFQENGNVHYHLLATLGNKMNQQECWQLIESTWYMLDISLIKEMWNIWNSKHGEEKSNYSAYKREVMEEKGKNKSAGFVYVKVLKRNKMAINYLTKYIIKNLDDKRLQGRKSYLMSKGLRKVNEIKIFASSLEDLKDILGEKLYDKIMEFEIEIYPGNIIKGMWLEKEERGEKYCVGLEY